MNIITGKMVICTFCGERIRIDKMAEMENLRRVYNLKCRFCGALVQYDGEFVDNLLAGRVKI